MRCETCTTLFQLKKSKASEQDLSYWKLNHNFVLVFQMLRLAISWPESLFLSFRLQFQELALVRFNRWSLP